MAHLPLFITLTALAMVFAVVITLSLAADRPPVPRTYPQQWAAAPQAPHPGTRAWPHPYYAHPYYLQPAHQPYLHHRQPVTPPYYFVAPTAAPLAPPAAAAPQPTATTAHTVNPEPAHSHTLPYLDITEFTVTYD
ncbi:hypothetical protein [Mycobacteroides salmoniphilum]|uniref:Uncharacterized protein n=1 Tax=Mycobacteroides salmoniphilum TaxID=404941 RepID=A0A4R8SZV7_9MYCO|nr:hypothetical protein [Mycobacteroides salmoniphilum]TEA09133.1 hypothetical protein CCUG60884_00302 [Mycobacteroides salmoniphilum]